ncbi:methylated-DNA--[protein]-cysteine S-methyltransferase [Amycolatopsis acidiphila]|uniref:methylated-DNA--[protein]-cysteine S-methyltransferase n=1 Tax=Amycolatopsis acidiphila TaxID=715473 RepID=A0A557ZMH1_9PSEU|nr:methylated-DNA--[protein]-cysteine S-methyltransferase [Amycolatopsis acidiphila]TVT13181.1 methylated-DNA--[protein]-cysteine S-methyltransferase [Amycolatopsis acidiphila]UIJ61054.1 methylated-DNA--[protein]-cysteine S-methyltransferase [Amycolatopsis acidiphila]GHG99227.1 methylated-DNA--[protein]-cysteine S-methyltransferase [Amycolatopsis acidiphila]
MTAQGFAVFPTAIGHCGIAWSERGVVSVRLPDGSAGLTRARLLANFPGATETEPPEHVQQAIAEIVALLHGESRDLAEIRLDLNGVPDFHRRVYEVARAILPGKTLTYGDVANLLGMPGSAQAVGQALGRNPFPIVVPCHRVLGANGRMVGFSAPGGVETKRRMLVIEGAQPDEPTLF